MHSCRAPKGTKVSRFHLDCLKLDCAFAQALDRDLEDAEEQHGTAVRGHLQLIDSLQDMQYARMKTMQEAFQSNLKVCCHV